MSETGDNGSANGGADQLIRRKDLVDELVLAYDRADGKLTVGGKIINLEVALNICQQAARYFETQLRLMAAQQVRQAAAEQERVRALLDRTRGRSS